MVGSVCWRFCIWLLAPLAVLTGNRHWCLPSLGYSDLSALVEGQVVSSWKRQEAIKYPRAVRSLTMHMVESRKEQNHFMPPNNSSNCSGPCCVLQIHSRLCPMSNNPPLWDMCAVVGTVSGFFSPLYLPFEKCAPWGKLSSWLCSASQEYMALASLQRQQKQAVSWQNWGDDKLSM